MHTEDLSAHLWNSTLAQYRFIMEVVIAFWQEAHRVEEARNHLQAIGF